MEVGLEGVWGGFGEWVGVKGGQVAEVKDQRYRLVDGDRATINGYRY